MTATNGKEGSPLPNSAPIRLGATRRRAMGVALVLACAVVAGLGQSGAPEATGLKSQRPTRIRVSAAVLQGLVAHRALPQYPREAMEKGMAGDAVFQILVDDAGKIALSAPVEGDPLLVAASVDALKDYRFRPYLLNAAPVAVESQIGFHFSLQKKDGGTEGQVECMPSVPYRPEFRTGAVNAEGVLVLWPHELSRVEPRLPPELAGKPGSVYLTITIGADGKVQDIKVVGGDKPFIAPAVAAVKQNIYEPQLVDGKPVASTTAVSYHFGSAP